MRLTTMILPPIKSSATTNPIIHAPNNNENIIPEKTNEKTKPNSSNNEKIFEFYDHDFTEDKIIECVNKCGHNPNPDYVEKVSKNIRNIPVQQRAMFLAHIIHESAGLSTLEEKGFEGNQMAEEYNSSVGKKGKSYYGRGFIQLTGPQNYLEASKYWKLGTLLLDEPERVCNDLDLAWKVSEYYWLKKVSKHWLVQQKMFWATTFCINGTIECVEGENNDAANAANTRWNYYLFVSETMGEKDPAEMGKDEMFQAIKTGQQWYRAISPQENEILEQKEEAKVSESEEFGQQIEKPGNKKTESSKDIHNNSNQTKSNEKIDKKINSLNITTSYDEDTSTHTTTLTVFVEQRD